MCLAIPGEILRTYSTDGVREADVRFGAIHRRICIDCTPEVRPGDYVLAHAGFALQQLDQDEARITLEMLAAVAQTSGTVESLTSGRTALPHGRASVSGAHLTQRRDREGALYGALRDRKP
jgi:hydrogenase expression/formation protein HypC